MTWRVSGYVAERLIGYGESSEVWQGRSNRTGQAVALKKVLAPEREQRQAARAEAAVLASLDHANLIRIRDVLATKDAIVLVLDLADGGSLRDLLHARGRLTPGEVATTISAAGAALAYAHSRQVMHGDVSAGNILYTAFGLPVVADLGAARLGIGEESVHATAAYLSPDVAAGTPAHPAGDVFALAAVAFHALTGQTVWASPSSVQMVEQARNRQRADVAERLAQTPRSLADLVVAALSLEAHRRPSAAEFALDVRLSIELAPIELWAGRPRPEPEHPEGGRHRQPTAAAGRVRDEPGRPRFERPLPTAPDRGQLTHGVRIALAEAPARRWWRPGRWLLRPLAVVALLALLAGVAFVSVDRLRSPRNPTQVPSPAAAQQAITAVALTGMLDLLDTLREGAFAQRRPELLDQVYFSASLRAQDVALIDRLVPDGCGLRGVHTTYSDVRLVSRTAEEIVITASATLSPSQVRCGASDGASMPGVPATSLRLSLTRTSAGPYLIDSLQLV